MRIVVLHGKESFLRLEWSRRLIRSLEATHGSIDRFEFDGATATLAAVLDELQTYGLMSRHKLVVLESAEVFMAAEDRRRAMERYAERPMAEATLLMRTSGPWRPGRFDALVQKVGGVFKCEAPSRPDTVRWCVNRARSAHRAEIAPELAELLVEKIGTDLARLDTELEKLATAAGTDPAFISRALVSEFVGLSREEQAWEIQAAMLEGPAGKALRKLDEIMGAGKSPEVMVAWSITDLASKLHDAARLIEGGVHEAEASRTIGLWGPQQKAILRSARRVGSRRAARLLQDALNTEVRMRRGYSGDDRRTLEGLIVHMTEAIS